VKFFVVKLISAFKEREIGVIVVVFIKLPSGI
jgi:hypothetical protein